MDESKFIKVAENLKIKGFSLVGKDNLFFRWKNNKKTEYMRLTLINQGWHENKVFYWNLETSFKPFKYKYNHRENANIKSEYFKENETDKSFNFFLNLVDLIKKRQRWFK